MKNGTARALMKSGSAIVADVTTDLTTLADDLAKKLGGQVRKGHSNDPITKQSALCLEVTKRAEDDGKPGYPFAILVRVFPEVGTVLVDDHIYAKVKSMLPEHKVKQHSKDSVSGLMVLQLG